MSAQGLPRFETVTVQHHHAKSPRQVRISRRVRQAIDLMVFEGQKRPDAAKAVGVTDENIRIALKRPDVLAYLDTQQQVLRTSAKARSIARIDNLADASASDHVKLDANKFLLGIEGISPVTRTENMHVHQHVIPGLTVIRDGWSTHGDDARQIDGLARESQEPIQINRIGTSVPHPEARNALPAPAETDGQPANRGGRRRGRGGEK